MSDDLSTWPDRPTLFTRANAVDQWPRPITPLTQDLVALPQERSLDRAFARDLGASPSLPPWSWNGVFHGWFTYSVEAAADMADNIPGYSRRSVYTDYFGVAEDPDADPVESAGSSPLAVARIGLNFVKAMRRYPRNARRDIERYGQRLSEDLARVWESVPSTLLLERLRSQVEEASEAKVPQNLSNVIAAPLFQSYSEAVTKAAGAEAPALITQSLSALGDIHLREATSAMRGVAAGTTTMEAFLRDYGFRGPNEFELMALPWRDDPANLARLIDAVSRHQDDESVAARDAARARVKELTGWRWPSVRFLLRQVETHMRWRENGKIAPAMATHSLRLVVREAGRRLVEEGRLGMVDDVYFLRGDELVAELEGKPAHDLGPRIAKRRASHVEAGQRPLPEMMDVRDGAVEPISTERWRSMGVLPPQQVETGAVLSGVSAAPGTATGRARIVTDPYEVDLEDGDIIFAAGTDSAWTPLFYQAAAVVVDIGGPMSHAAIAAREVGIPCVMNVKSGTTGSVVEGQSVTVDGSAGSVTLR